MNTKAQDERPGRESKDNNFFIKIPIGLSQALTTIIRTKKKEGGATAVWTITATY